MLSYNQIELEDVEVFLTESSAKERLLGIYRKEGFQSIQKENYCIQALESVENRGFQMTHRGLRIDENGEFVSFHNS